MSQLETSPPVSEIVAEALFDAGIALERAISIAFTYAVAF